MVSWTRQAIGLATFGFINMVLFIVLSNPFTTLLDIIHDESANPASDVADDVRPILNNLRTIFGLMFVLSFVGLIMWFILGSHQEEFEEY